MTKTFSFKIEVFHFNIFHFFVKRNINVGGFVSLTINDYNTFNLKVFLQNEDNLTFLGVYLTFDDQNYK